MPPNFDDFSGLPTEIANGSIVLLHLITLSHFSIDARSSLDGPIFRKIFLKLFLKILKFKCLGLFDDEKGQKRVLEEIKLDDEVKKTIQHDMETKCSSSEEVWQVLMQST